MEPQWIVTTIYCSIAHTYGPQNAPPSMIYVPPKVPSPSPTVNYIIMFIRSSQSPEFSVLLVQVFYITSFSTVESDNSIRFQNTSLGLDNEFHCLIN